MATEWATLPTDEKVVALTIDCGGDDAGIPKILAALDAADVAATFFFTGAWINRFPESAREVARSHRFGNHTYSHPHMTALTDAEVREEITTTEEVIREVTGADPVRLFRFPFGERDERTRRLVGEFGYTSVYWTVDTLGWKGGEEGISVATIEQRVLDALRPGAIILMHAGAGPDRSTLDADALPGLIRRIESRGYRFVRADDYLPR